MEVSEALAYLRAQVEEAGRIWSDGEGADDALRPWAALKVMAELIESQHPKPCTMCHTNNGCRTGRALVSAAEALKGKGNE